MSKTLAILFVFGFIACAHGQNTNDSTEKSTIYQIDLFSNTSNWRGDGYFDGTDYVFELNDSHVTFVECKLDMPKSFKRLEYTLDVRASQNFMPKSDSPLYVYKDDSSSSFLKKETCLRFCPSRDLKQFFPKCDFLIRLVFKQSFQNMGIMSLHKLEASSSGEWKSIKILSDSPYANIDKQGAFYIYLPPGNGFVRIRAPKITLSE